MKLTLENLVLAYRQAKQLMAAEKKNLGRAKLARYENELPQNLETLRRQLERGGGLFDHLPVATAWAVPKKATYETSEQEIERPGSNCDAVLSHLETRIALEPSLPYACAEILWMWRFGPALELALTDHCIANRLRRDLTDSNEVDKRSRFIYNYWQEAYRSFMEDGLACAEEHLSRSESCLVVSADLETCYDNIDPTFLLSEKFVGRVEDLCRQHGIEFRRRLYERETGSFLRALRRFSAKAKRLVPSRSLTRGIPIGGLASGLVSNLALAPVDEKIGSAKSLSYYKRYVDDIFIVLKNEKKRLTTRKDVTEELGLLGRWSEQCANNENNRKTSRFDLDVDHLGRAGCRFRFNSRKFRIIAINGDDDSTFLKKIREDREALTSEFRVFVEPPTRENRLEAFSLSSDGSKINVLRDAEKLTLRRYGSSIEIGRIEHKVEILDPSESKAVSERDLRPIALRASDELHWIDFLDAVFRCLRISVRARDEDLAKLILSQLNERIGALGADDKLLPSLSDAGRESLINWFRLRIIESLAASVPFTHTPSVSFFIEFPNIFLNPRKDLRHLRHLSRTMFRAGLRLAKPSRDIEISNPGLQPKKIWSVGDSWRHLNERLMRDSNESLRGDLSKVREFLSLSKDLGEETFLGANETQLLLSANPPTYFDVAWKWAEAGREPDDVHLFVNSLRGTRYQQSHLQRKDSATLVLGAEAQGYGFPPLFLPGEPFGQAMQQCCVVLGNLVTEYDWFKSAINGKPIHSEARLRGLARVLNLALGTGVHLGDEGERPDPQQGSKAWLSRLKATLLILPELSVPRKWLPSVAQQLSREGVNLIAGLEYSMTDRGAKNAAVGLFPTGLARIPVVQWQKRKPADFEGQLCISEAKVQFHRLENEAEPRLVVWTPFGKISTLICSELLESTARADLVGRVELLAVPAWNRDTATFDHTIRTAAQDLHCFIALANNGTYSDCRIRAPMATRWLQDIARLINRNVDEVLSVDLEIVDPKGNTTVASLRQFHEGWARHSHSGQASDEAVLKKPAFKPVPPDFD